MEIVVDTDPVTEHLNETAAGAKATWDSAKDVVADSAQQIAEQVKPLADEAAERVQPIADQAGPVVDEAVERARSNRALVTVAAIAIVGAAAFVVVRRRRRRKQEEDL